MKTKNKEAESDNVVEIKDNGETNKAAEMPHLSEKELQQFKLHDAEMTKRLLLIGNTNLTIRLENAEFNQKIATLNNLRDQQEEDSKMYQELYEEFNRTIMKKYGIKNDKKISIDTETGVIRELP